ncbi:cytochrome b5 reductase family protein [Nakaseomyces bracarensis]|uniref:cytochrome b5 reductase family protein n=1 Tax=Nakaseomyces bracarensis TaxID=273131 RepID=UPI00387284E9
MFIARYARQSPKIVPYAVGAIAIGVGVAFLSSEASTVINDSSKAFNGGWKWIDLELEKVVDESHDSKRFIFKLPTDDSASGLKLASALLTRIKTRFGFPIIRPYTPINDMEDKGYIEFLIKHYEGGKMTDHLFNMKPKDTLSFQGPIATWEWKANSYDSLTLIGGGAGITPLYQLIRNIAKNPEDKTKINLYYGNKTPNDILLKKELDEIQRRYPDKVKVTYFVDNDPTGKFEGNVGYITKDFLAENAPGPTENTIVFVCGPPPLMDSISGQKRNMFMQGPLNGALKELGYSSDQVFKF